MGAGAAWSEVAALTFTGGLGAVASRDCVEAPPCWRAPAVATKRSATATAESASVRAWFPCMIPPTFSLRDRILRPTAASLLRDRRRGAGWLARPELVLAR